MSDTPQIPDDEYMTREQVSTLHKVLTGQLESMLAESRAAVSNLTEQREVDADHVDLAVNESSRDFALRLADRERRLLRKIRHALERIRQGEYGVCESCGESITYPRLMARPVATLCIDCKTELEQLERPRGSFV
ncbi:MAG: RNA polymerase-binding protein DksA [Myxococcota bacterium]